MKKGEKQTLTGCQKGLTSTSSLEVEIPIGRHWVRAIDMGRIYSDAKAQANGWGGLMDERRASLWSSIDAALQTAITKGDVRVSETVDGAFLAPSTDAYSIGWLELQRFCNWAPAILPDCPTSASELASIVGLPPSIAKTLSGEEHIVAWFDEVIHARTWFLRPVVSPNDAALLLCQHDPEEIGLTLEKALHRRNTETGPSELQQLSGMFKSVSDASAIPRTLLDWIAIAEEKQLRFHSWIKTYVSLTKIGSKEGLETAGPFEVPSQAMPIKNASPNSKVWTPERLAEVKAYRDMHGTKKAAEHFGCSPQLIRKKLPKAPPQSKGYNAFTYRPK